MYALSHFADAYPQRRDWREINWLDRLSERFRASVRCRVKASALRQRMFVRRVEQVCHTLEPLDEASLNQYLSELRRDLRREGLSNELSAKAFALVRVFSGQVLGMAHYPAQLRGGYLLLSGHLAEMDTGEGKTLTATLAAATAALSGSAVHVVTVNDYLAARDYALMKPLYERLGLTTGLVSEDMDTEQKKIAYRANIVYCTNKILVFDYLRDRIELGDRMTPLAMAFDSLTENDEREALLPGLQFAIVDEADSVFIDEARTPLVISASRPDAEAESFYQQALTLAEQLTLGEDFTLGAGGRMPELTTQGCDKLALLSETMAAVWQAEFRREETVQQALTALHGFQRDVHYIVRDEKVMIVDESTGRVMPDRSWERGLQQLIEAKESVEMTPEKETLARISFQLFFRRYLVLSGMTGTCQEVKGEVGEVYGLGVVRVPPNKPSLRKCLPTQIYAQADKRWQSVVDVVKKRHLTGQPVLVGTRSIRASEKLHDYLMLAGIDHQVLNAKQGADEADIVSLAGQKGRVTIATNMAGRGTDIKLGDGVEALGGLHVILTEGHDTPRVDRQLAGRSARQGEPGSWQALLSLQDEVLEGYLEYFNAALFKGLSVAPRSRVLQWLALAYYRSAQAKAEFSHRRMRRRLLNADFQQRKSLSFSGQME